MTIFSLIAIMAAVLLQKHIEGKMSSPDDHMVIFRRDLSWTHPLGALIAGIAASFLFWEGSGSKTFALIVLLSTFLGYFSYQLISFQLEKRLQKAKAEINKHTPMK